MSPTLRKKWILGIVIFSVILIAAYDLWSILKSRPKACDLSLQNCPANFFCSLPAEKTSARCLPKASMPGMVLDIPFASNVGVICHHGNLDPKVHFDDFNSFSFELGPDEKLSDPRAQPDWIVSPADGSVFVYQNRIRILHGEGYISEIYPIKDVHLSGGPVRSGEYLGKRGGPTLHWGIHYLNAQLAAEVLSQSPNIGLSIPFRLRFIQNPALKEKIDIIDSDKLDCSPGSDLRLFRADVPL